MTTRIFLLAPGRSAAGVLRAGVHSTLHGVVFAIFCPGPAVHRRRDSLSGPGHEIVSASRVRDQSIQFQHIMLQVWRRPGDIPMPATREAAMWVRVSDTMEWWRCFGPTPA